MVKINILASASVVALLLLSSSDDINTGTVNAIKLCDDDDYDFYKDNTNEMDKSISHLPDGSLSDYPAQLAEQNKEQDKKAAKEEAEKAVQAEITKFENKEQGKEATPSESAKKPTAPTSAKQSETQTDQKGEAKEESSEEADESGEIYFKKQKKTKGKSKKQVQEVAQSSLISKMIPIVYDDKLANPQITQQERDLMKGNIELNVIEEPMDHYSTEDDSYLKKLVEDKKRGESFRAVVVKDDMMNICTEVMGRWFNVKGQDNQNFMNRFFFEKWKDMDSSGKGEILIDEAVKFIRDYIGAMVQV